MKSCYVHLENLPSSNWLTALLIFPFNILNSTFRKVGRNCLVSPYCLTTKSTQAIKPECFVRPIYNSTNTTLQRFECSVNAALIQRIRNYSKRIASTPNIKTDKVSQALSISRNTVRLAIKCNLAISSAVIFSLSIYIAWTIL